MNFGDLQQAVLEVRERPDKIAAIRRYINSTIARYSKVACLPRFLVEATYSTGVTASQANQLPIPDRFIRLDYVEPTDDLGCRLNPINRIGAARNQYGYYVTGSGIMVQTPTAVSEFNLGYYQYPERLVADDDTNWFVEYMFDEIVDMTLANLAVALGDARNAAVLNNFTEKFIDQQIRQAVLSTNNV